MKFLIATTLALGISVLLVGCGQQGPPRIEASGAVTWQGNPVPAGYITFDPDSSQGNSGSQGYAEVVAGVYDTRNSNGRPLAPGAVIATVYGYDGINPTESAPLGSPLFPPYEMPLVLSDASQRTDFVLPESSTP